MPMQHFRRLLLALFFLLGGLTWFVLAAHRQPAPATPAATAFYFHHEHVIGTSLDLWLTTSEEAAADAAEQVILDEIERLRRIFSTYDPHSEINRLNRATGPYAASPEMIEVLHQYEIWQERSHGAFHGQLGELVQVWKEAEKNQREPDPATLSRIVHQLRQPGWRIDGRTVTRLTDQPLNLNSIAKGYIIGRAGDLARAKVPALRGLLLNLGGDLYVWGKDDMGRRGRPIGGNGVPDGSGQAVTPVSPWLIGVQDPHHPEDNAPVLARLRLHNRAVATSGGYERYYTIHGKRHSHIFDPRTGASADGAASATVIADDNVTANALATTLCVLTPEEGLRLAAGIPHVEVLIVAKDGKQLRSPGFAACEEPLAAATQQDKDKKDKQAPQKAQAWPDSFQVNIAITLPSVKSVRYRRPYVAVWVEDAKARPVRTITVWGNNPRYIKDLPQWWKFARDDNAMVRAVTRATRAPGKHQLLWDGKDDKGMALPQGTYTVFVEVHREHGRLVRQTGKLTCGPEPATLTLEANSETGATVIEYAKKK